MIIYSPLDGEVLTTKITSRPRCCFLMTQLGNPVPEGVEAIRGSVSDLCTDAGYEVIDARTQVTGRDFLLKIADQLERNPVLAIDYLRRAFLISGNEGLRGKARALLDQAGVDDRAKNSVEQLAAAF